MGDYMSYKEDLAKFKPEYERILKQRETLTKVLGNLFKLKGMLQEIHFKNNEGIIELNLNNGFSLEQFDVIRAIMLKLGYRETKANSNRYTKDNMGDVEATSIATIEVRLSLEENNPACLRYLRGREKLIDLIDSVPKGASVRDALMKSKLATRINGSIFKLHDTGYIVFKSDTDWDFFRNIADIYSKNS